MHAGTLAKMRTQGALTAQGYPAVTSPHEGPGCWQEMQSTIYPSAMGQIVGAPEASGADTHAVQFLHTSSPTLPHTRPSQTVLFTRPAP